jgi:hypothetical protein
LPRCRAFVGRDGLRLKQMLSVFGFLLSEHACSAARELPAGTRAVRASQVAPAKGGVDAIVNLDFLAAFGGEQEVQG